MKIAMSATREKFPLSPKKIIKKTLASAVSTCITLLILWGTIVAALFSTRAEITTLGISMSLLMWIVGAVLCVLCVVNIILTYVYYRWYIVTYFYDLTPDFIQIRKGPITPREITIPYERIQDVYVDQDLFDRFFGLYDVHLSSATASSGLTAHIDGVEKDVADGLRKVLLDTVKNRISKNRG